MKKKIFTLLALFAGVLSANAQGVTIKSVEMVPDGEAKINLELSAAASFLGCSFDLNLPDGVTPVMAEVSMPTENSDADVAQTMVKYEMGSSFDAIEKTYVFSKVDGQKVTFLVFPKTKIASPVACAAGTIMTVFVKAPATAVPDGKTSIELAGSAKNILLSDGSKDIAASDLAIAFNTYRSGDINGDGKRNGSDYDVIADIILEKKSATDFIARAGDLNGDGKINGSDYDFVADIILEKKSINAPELKLEGNEIEPE